MIKCDIICPENILDLQNTLKDSTTTTKILAGGTDLIIALNERLIKADKLIDISRLNQFHTIYETDNFIFIGPLVTFTEVENNPLIKQYAYCLHKAASMVGSTQIRNRATLVGNIGNASPVGDGLCALMSLDAYVEIMNSNGDITEKRLSDILVSKGKLSLHSDEIIVNVKIKKLKENQTSTFVKIGSRKSVTISKINMSTVVTVDKTENSIKNITVALGSLGQKCFTSDLVNERLTGMKIDGNLEKEFKKTLQEVVDEAIKGRSSLPYKRQAILGLAEDTFEELFNYK